MTSGTDGNSGVLSPSCVRAGLHTVSSIGDSRVNILYCFSGVTNLICSGDVFGNSATDLLCSGRDGGC
uniref:Uncharacterized protein n=1 Tax=Anguilla anguilla TaxID=7936 RepID=A0A0E9RJX6_ANGAN